MPVSIAFPLLSAAAVVIGTRATPSAATLSSSAVRSLSWEARAGVDGPGRHHPVTFANETHAFLLSGSLGGPAADAARASSALHVYDAAADAWTPRATGRFPGRPRSFGYGAALPAAGDPRAFVGFGAALDDGARLSDWWSFDMATLAWRELAPCPGTGRRHPAVVVVNSGRPSSPSWRIHVGLGDGVVDGGFANLRDWWSYDVDRNAWTALEDFPGVPRHHPFYFGLGSTAYVGLGHSSFGIERDWYGYRSPGDGQGVVGWVREADFASVEVGSAAAPVTTEARVAGTEFSIELPLVGAAARAGGEQLSGAFGFVLSGDGSDHSTMPEGEFHAFVPPEEGGDDGAWVRLPPHPGVSRWAPGSFVLRGTARAYFTSGYDRQARTLHSDLWSIDLSPLFTTRPQSGKTKASKSRVSKTKASKTRAVKEVDDNPFS